MKVILEARMSVAIDIATSVVIVVCGLGSFYFLAKGYMELFR
jgi:hypothetical protein